MSADSLVVWQLSDGKRGHARQVEGLLGALADTRRIDHHVIDIARCRPAQLWHALWRRFPEGDGLPDPALIVGAGNACQYALLAAHRARGGRSIYLMRPDLPPACFDIVVAPRHDGLAARANIILTEGVLNPLGPTAERDTALGLFLLGGPSKHHAWDTRRVIAQLERRLAAAPARRWQVTDSRRSPADLRTALQALAHASDHLTYVPAETCTADWLPHQLARAAEAWVSVDSVSMLYETLSAGAVLGLIDIPARRRDRVTAIADDLHGRGWAIRAGEAVPAQPAVVLSESRRVAALLRARWPELRE